MDDKYLSEYIIRYKQKCRETSTDLVGKFLKDGDLVLDVGEVVPDSNTCGKLGQFPAGGFARAYRVV